jgi:hypothetical protein
MSNAKKAERMAQSYLTELFDTFGAGDRIKAHVLRNSHHIDYLPQKDHLVVIFDLSADVEADVPTATRVRGEQELPGLVADDGVQDAPIVDDGVPESSFVVADALDAEDIK